MISLNIYQRPAQGTAFIRRYANLANYKHRWLAVGGCDTASCDLAVPPKEAEFLIEQYLGCRVAFYAKNPQVAIWEGLITRITLEYGTIEVTFSIEEMNNRVRTNYHNKSTGAMVTNAAGDNTTSQALYGIKEGSFDGYTQNAGVTTRAANLRDAYVATQSFPQTSTDVKLDGGNARLHLEMQGFFHTLEWEQWSSTSTAGITTTTIFTNVLAALSNAATFINNTDVTLIQSLGYSFNQYSQTGMTVWQFFQQFQEAGDGLTPWVMGVLQGKTASERKFYLQAENRVVEYLTSTRRNPGVIRNLYGVPVAPYDVRPDRILRYDDILIGYNLPGDDPRETYIEAVNFDAERMQVTVQGNDDITLEGAFGLRKFYRKHFSRQRAAQIRQMQP